MLHVWERIRSRAGGWCWVVPRLPAGDLYQLAALVPAFRQAHGDGPIRLVLNNARQARMAAVFDHAFADIVVEPELSHSREQWAELFEQADLPPFGMETPIITDPALNPYFPESTWQLAEAAGLPWTHVYKHLLRIPLAAEPAAPAVNPERQAEARRLAAAAGVTPGRSVLFFPYAQSHPAEAEAHFARLAEVLAPDYEAFTAVGPGEVPIAGARALAAPFALLPDLAEYAGWAVGLRSGVSDLLAPARCRKTFVYRSLAEMQNWSLLQLDLARDAAEFPFAFHLQDPDAFVQAVLASPGAEYWVSRARGMSWRLAARHERFACPERLEPGQDLVLHDLPYRGHPRQDPAEQLARLARIKGDRRLYVCRDGGQIDYARAQVDFWEEVDADTLLAGDYYAASYWHSVAAVRDPLPGALALEPLTDDGVDLADPASRAAQAVNATWAAPYSFRGVTLIEGWRPAEGWGAWGLGSHSRLRLVFQECPQGGFNLGLSVNAAISERCPVLTVEVEVSGTPVARHRLTLDGGRELETVVPPALVRGRVVHVDLRTSPVMSPFEQGQSGDRRKLGLGLRAVRASPRD